jgi:hypothetical protein
MNPACVVGTIRLLAGGTLRRGFSITRALAKCALVVGIATAISATWAQESPDALAPGAFGTRAGAPIQRVASPDASSAGWAQLGIALLIVAVGLRWGLPRLRALGRQNRRRLARRRTDTDYRNAQRSRGQPDAGQGARQTAADWRDPAGDAPAGRPDRHAAEARSRAASPKARSSRFCATPTLHCPAARPAAGSRRAGADRACRQTRERLQNLLGGRQ